MTEEVVERLIQEHAGLPFEMKSDEIMIGWHVAVVDDTLLARRVGMVGNDNDRSSIDYFDVPYNDWDARDYIYGLMAQDFIDCYAEDLYFGRAKDHSLFSYFASPDDEGLLGILRLFMMNYGEFLQDVFFRFGEWIDEYQALLVSRERDQRQETPKDPDEIALIKKMRLARRVLDHCETSTLELVYDDDSKTRLTFADADGKIWYLRQDLMYEGEDELTYIEEYGSVDKDNPDSYGALQDVVISLLICADKDRRIKDGNPYGLIGIDPDDLDDED